MTARATFRQADITRAIKAAEALLTVSEAADLLAVSSRTVARLCADGGMPAFRVGRQWRIDAADLRRWLEARKSGTWRRSISAAIPGGSVSSGAAKKSDDPLAQLLKAKPENISALSNRNTGA